MRFVRRSMRCRIVARVTTVCVVIAALGCVSSGKYEQAASERDALVAEKTELERQLAELQRETVALDGSAQTLQSELDQRKQKISEMTKTYDALVADLRGELDSGKVEIEQLRNGIRLNVADDVLFDSGSAMLDDKGHELLVKVAAQLVSSRNRIEVLGHTDDRPIRAATSESRYPSNWELGAARAASVVRLLQSQGIEGSRMRATSTGEFEPMASNESKEGRARNRRIEIRLAPPPSEGAAGEIEATPEASPPADHSGE